MQAIFGIHLGKKSPSVSSKENDSKFSPSQVNTEQKGQEKKVLSVKELNPKGRPVLSSDDYPDLRYLRDPPKAELNESHGISLSNMSLFIKNQEREDNISSLPQRYNKSGHPSLISCRGFPSPRSRHGKLEWSFM